MWSPLEVRKIIAQLSGIISLIGGFWLMIIDAKANGTISLTLLGVSGEIQSSSAGLFFAFFGFLMIIYPVFTKKENKMPNNLFVIIGFAIVVIAIVLVAYLAPIALGIVIPVAFIMLIILSNMAVYSNEKQN